MKEEKIKMSQKQLKRYEVISKTIDGFITVSEASDVLGLSERQIKRLKKKVKDFGVAALIHKNSENPPHNALPSELKQKILDLKKSDNFKNANFMHFRELLDDYYDINISYSALYTLLTKEGFKSPMVRRRFKPHRRRKRRPQAGMLLQVDATPFAWFSGFGDKKSYSLHGAIDDATNQITALYLCKNECLQGYFEMLRNTVKNFGIPLSIYADRHTIFRSPKADKLTREEILDGVSINDTQFGRCLNELNIQLIPARSPQAKGRIERLWKTLQSRLPIEFMFNNIHDIDSANSFLEKYIYKFNSVFVVDPTKAQNAFRKPATNINLDNIICIKETRTVDSGGIFSYQNKKFRIDDASCRIKIPPNTPISVLVSPKFGIKAQYRDIIYDAARFVQPKKTKPPKTGYSADKMRRPPNENFGKKNDYALITGFNSDDDIKTMLASLFLSKYA